MTIVTKARGMVEAHEVDGPAGSAASGSSPAAEEGPNTSSTPDGVGADTAVAPTPEIVHTDQVTP